MGAAKVQPLWVDDPRVLAGVCEQAARARRVAVDTEADSLHSYFHKLCLVQLSFADMHAVIDPLVLGRDGMRPLGELLSDAVVAKLLHGADYDLRVLDRDLGARPRNVADTQMAALLLGEAQTSLAALVEREVGVVLDKSCQRTDWGARPLSPEQLAYAAGDTAYLGVVADRLAERLRSVGRLEWWHEESAALEEIRWEPSEPDPLAFERVKGGRALRGEARDRLAALHRWREDEAAAADVPPFKVMHAETLLALAAEPPADLESLAAVRGIGRSLVRRHGATLLRLLASPAPAPPREERRRPPVDKLREARMRELRAARDEVAAELGIAPGVLGPKAVLERALDRDPRDATAWSACLGRCWRAEVLAPRLATLLAQWRGGNGGADAGAPR